ncbi:hypothetical protein HELRODRAFT_160805 [Helobdella robusta]|uniref:Apple domain-containing protein n=1 Tax=Helobdella robusta TaxID=6412 RepID=T1EQQ9_HELRO|nr:hypothetical protein HELRODRAFT_160805 [Helobdella robusta]ESO06615.1 hypothetical protein HELRODRAFT_160805 [Helobdella robusta]
MKKTLILCLCLTFIKAVISKPVSNEHLQQFCWKKFEKTSINMQDGVNYRVKHLSSVNSCQGECTEYGVECEYILYLPKHSLCYVRTNRTVSPALMENVDHVVYQKINCSDEKSEKKMATIKLKTRKIVSLKGLKM